MKTQLRSSPPTLAGRLEEFTHYAEVKRIVDTLMALQRKKAFQSLAVLSLFPGEGRTFVASVMAIAYAGVSRSRVLVVDTTTVKNPKSLGLRQCLTSHQTMIDFVSLEEYRRGSNGNGAGNGNGGHPSSPEWRPQAPPLEADLVTNGAVTLMVAKKSDQSLIQALAEERAGQYGLIVLDTAPLTATNMNNIDPLLVARMSDASLLVAGPQLMNEPNLETHLKALKDPSLHLVGIVSNEECAQ